MTHYTIKDIATALGAEAEGNLDLIVTTINQPQLAKADELALAMEETYSDALQEGNAKAAVVWNGADWSALGLEAAIFAPRSRYTLSGLTHLFENKPHIGSGLHPTAVIDPTAKIGANSSIGPFVVIGANVVLGDSIRIASHVSIAEDVVIGNNALILQGARIGARVRIGDDFIAQPNSVVGADGFSFVTPQPSAIDEARKSGTISAVSETAAFARINSLGAVFIGDRVEIGACSTVDRGTIIDTVIGNGTKLDNLVQIGHNVVIGENCLLCGNAGVGGSTVIGDRVILGGKCGVADHITIGSDVIAAAKAGISSNVPPKRVIMGNPAVKMELSVDIYKATRRLPRLVAKVAELEKIVFKKD